MSAPALSRRPWFGSSALLLLAALAACDDGPTQPGVYSHAADGRIWAAVKTPDALPSLRTWLPYLRPETTAADSALRAVRALQADAEQMRRNGDLEAADAREVEASLQAVRAITRTPPARVLILALSSLQLWGETAAEAARTSPLPELGVAADEVREARTAAIGMLERGDTVGALAEIVTASATARSFAPAAVALRALAEAERRLAARDLPGEDGDRALRLLRHAREALADGDDGRALRRALYALQLAEAASATAVGDAGVHLAEPR